MNILIVEDELAILQTITLKLKKEGYEVTGFNTAVEALQKLESFTPDLIMTDILMPYMSGLEFISAVKQQKQLSSIPIFVLSTLGQEDSVEEAFMLGADDYLKKPVSLTEVVLRIKKMQRLQSSKSRL